MEHSLESGRLRAQIETIITVASKCHYAISLDELFVLLPEKEITGLEELRSILNPSGTKLFAIQDDLIVLRGFEHLFAERSSRENVSSNYVETARSFAKDLQNLSSDVKTIAVSGSSSYRSADLSHDIDIFLVSRNHGLWITLLKALLLARLYQIKAITHGRKTSFCLSYLLEEDACKTAFRTSVNPLFAREALAAMILEGRDFYAKLLEANDWIGTFYPRLFRERLMELNGNRFSNQSFKKDTSSIETALNLALYVFFKIFLSFKGFLRNLVFAKKRRQDDLFDVIITRSSCLYTSRRYQRIAEMYRRLSRH